MKTLIGEGLPASPGAATGKVVFTPDDAEAMANLGEDVILVRKETTPEDIHGMKSAQGGERRGERREGTGDGGRGSKSATFSSFRRVK